MPIYMRIDGIEGASTSFSHPNWHDVLSMNWGLINSGSTGGGGGGGASRAQFQDLSIVKTCDKGSPRMFLACANGRHIREVEFDIMSHSGETEFIYQKVKLTDVVITGYRSSSDAGSLPSEEVSFAFARVDYSQWVYDELGQVREIQTNWWDVKASRGG